MPRPLVEVRQAVLNPVVTINDPQQEVCLVGLNTADYTDRQIHELDIPGNASEGAVLHVSQADATDLVFDLDTAGGILVNQEVDFGPDEYDISGDHTVNFSDVFFSVDASTAHNILDDLSQISPVTLNAEVAGLAALVHDAPASVLVAQPNAIYKNKIVVATGESVNFLTDPEFSAILDSGELTLESGGTHHDFVILRVEADAIYVRGKAEVDHAILAGGTIADLVYAGNSGMHTDPNAVPGNRVADNTRFKLTHPGVHEIPVLSVDGAEIISNRQLPFVIRETDNASFIGAVLIRLSDEEAANLSQQETGSNQDLFSIGTPVGDSTPLTVKADALKVDLDGDSNADYAIVRAKLSMSYTLAKNNLSAGLSSVSLDLVEGLLGVPSPRNPLALAAELALLNSGNSNVKVLGLDISPRDGETELRSVEAAFVDALSIINRDATVYAMVPLTTNMNVTKAYANAAESLSTPAKGKFRICLGSSNGSPEQDYIIASPLSPARLGTVAAGVLTNSAGTMYRLPTSKVFVGDTVTATATVNDVVTYYIGTVAAVTNDSLTVTWDAIPGVPAGALTGYWVSRSLSPISAIDRQIELLEADASSVASKRLFLTFPGTCAVTSLLANGSTFQGVPSYFVTSAFSGLLARFEIHRPKNFLGLTGVSGLQDFSRFSDEQLDRISDAGYLVFQQESPGSQPFCIHQVNTYHGTASGTQEFTELSVLANFDFVARYLKEVLDPFAGTVNIVPTTLGVIQASLDAAMDNLSSRRVATIGAPLLSGSVEFVRQASYDSGTVEANVLVSIPKVLNKIILEVVSG